MCSARKGSTLLNFKLSLICSASLLAGYLDRVKAGEPIRFATGHDRGGEIRAKRTEAHSRLWRTMVQTRSRVSLLTA